MPPAALIEANAVSTPSFICRPSSLADPLNGAAMPNRISLSETPLTAGPAGGIERAAVVVGAGAEGAVGTDGAATVAAGAADGAAVDAAVAAPARAVVAGAAGDVSSTGAGDGSCVTFTAEAGRVGAATGFGAAPVG